MIGVVVGVMSDAGVSVVRKWLVVPELSMAHCLMVLASVLVVLRRVAAVRAYLLVGFE